MSLIFKDFDGKYSPRPIQQEAMEALEKVYDKQEIIIMQLTVGSGKGPLSRAVQRAVRQKGERAIIIHPNNILINQLKGDYPEMNHLVGSNHYKCSDPLFDSCGAKKAAEGKAFEACPGCPHRCAFKGFVEKEDTVTNVQTYSLLGKFFPDFPEYDCIIMDEADACVRFLESMTGVSIPEDLTVIKDSDVESLESALKVLDRAQRALEKKRKVENDPKKKDAIDRKIEHYGFIKDLTSESPERYAWEIQKSEQGKKSLSIAPVIIPRNALEKLFGKKVILLSATIFPSHLKQILGNKVHIETIKGTSPFDPWRQQVSYQMFPGGLDYKTKIDKICNRIGDDMEKFGVDGIHTNTLIHSAYSQRKEYVECLRSLGIPALTHDKGDKSDVLQEWKESGGILVGAGMAEGIDLKDDLVRLQILPRIIKGTGAVLEKRRKLPRGWDLDMLRLWGNVLQTIGRGCRNPEDFCIFLTYDPYFLRLLNKMKKMGEAPEYAYKTISVTGKLHKDTPENWKEMFSNKRKVS